MVRGDVEWPEWWDWSLDFGLLHLAARMRSRSFNETDLREMLQEAYNYRTDVEPGRWVIETRRNAVRWEIIVEPQEAEQVLLVVTAYAVQ